MESAINLREIARAQMRGMIKDGLTGEYSYTKGRLPGIWRRLPVDVSINAVFGRLEEKQYVRMQQYLDDAMSFGALTGDCYDPDVNININININVLKKQENQERERINVEGVWVHEALWRLDKARLRDSDFESADSCGGFIGDDFEESGYSEDLKNAAITELARAVGAPRLLDAHSDPRQAAYVFMFTLQLMGLDVGGKLEDFRWP
jgi:hypothetical protein